MHRVAHGIVWFSEQIKQRVLDLMQVQSSASRSAYQAIHKHNLKGNDIKKYAKKNYMKALNQRYISDAVSRVSSIVNDSALFGGKKSWNKLQSGTLSKKAWQQQRNNQLYSRGDRAKKGNPNIRIVGEKLFINDPSKRGLWLEGKLFIPNKWQLALDCYNVRLLYRNNKFEVKISWDAVEVPKISTVGGAIGIDTNPDGVAVVEVSDDGNLQYHQYEREQRIQFACKEKRDYDVKQLAVRIVSIAKETCKPIMIEKLSFGKGKRSTKKFRRMRYNFLHRQITEAVESRADREGIPIVKINSAFTSILGKLKYQKLYSLNSHISAALVIARRGIGYLERQDFTVMRKKSNNKKLTLEGRGFKHTLTLKAYSWLTEGPFCKPKPAALTAPCLAPGSKPGIGHSTGVIPVGEASTTTGRWGQHQMLQVEERPPSQLIEVE